MNEQMKDFDAAAPAPVVQPKIYAEDAFNRWWVQMISAAMLKSGKGFRMDTPKRRPPAGASKYRGERRADKEGTTKTTRALLRQGAGR